MARRWQAPVGDSMRREKHAGMDLPIKGEGFQADCRYCYGAALAAAGQMSQAEEEQRAVLKSYSLLLPPDGAHPQSAGARLALGNLLSRRADSQPEGLRLVQQAVAMREEFLGPDDPRTREARDSLANLQAPKRGP
jgi:hypothetical protein